MFGKLKQILVNLGKTLVNFLGTKGWKGLGIATTCALVCTFFILPPYPHAQGAETKKTSISQQTPSPAPNADSDTDKLEERIKSLEEKERANYAATLENGRKAVDWWLSFIGIMLGAFALFAAIIPFLMAKQDKERMQLELQMAQQAKEGAEKAQAEAEKVLDQLKQHEAQAKASAEVVEKAKQQIEKAQLDDSEEEQEKTKQAVAELKQAANLSLAEQLKLNAVDAQTQGKYAEAADYFRAYLRQNPNDANAWLRLTHVLGQQIQQEENSQRKLLLAQEIAAAAERNTQLDSRSHGGFNNWGCALNNQAQALASTEPEKAQDLWTLAEEKYQQALAIKPDKHEALYNWGNALSHQSQALVNTEPEKAQALWTLAGEKYQQALAIKPDFRVALSNWGLVLLTQYDYEADLQKKVALLANAEELLQKAVQLDEIESAYSMACLQALKGDAAAAVFWLEKSKPAANFPGKAHIEEEKDLDGIRQTEVFQNWFKQTFPDQAE